MSRSVSDIHPLFSDQLLAVNREESSRNVESETMSMRCPNRNAVGGGGGVCGRQALCSARVCAEAREVGRLQRHIPEGKSELASEQSLIVSICGGQW